MFKLVSCHGASRELTPSTAKCFKKYALLIAVPVAGKQHFQHFRGITNINNRLSIEPNEVPHTPPLSAERYGWPNCQFK